MIRQDASRRELCDRTSRRRLVLSHKSRDPVATPGSAASAVDPTTAVPAVLAAATVLAQIAYPLVPGDGRNRLTVATVLLFFAASVTHALATRGPRFTAALVAVTAGGGLLAEAVGTHTGVPFGRYTYAGTLGPQLLAVPVVIPLAWTMMAYPALLVGRQLTQRRPGALPLVAGLALASWDLFLDPQMVAAGHWGWLDIGATLPGVPDVPVGNYLGWLATAVLMMAVLARVLARVPTRVPTPAGPSDDRVPMALYLWTYASSVLANVAFFHRPAVAVIGGIGMGLVAVPLALALRRPR